MSRVVVVGSGAREHALAWKLALSANIREIVLAPGNSGMRKTLEPFVRIQSLPLDLSVQDFAETAQDLRGLKPDLVLVGPDHPLAFGIVDECQRLGLAVFGPTKAAARLESSKLFAKKIMERAGVPTAKFTAFENSRDPALADWIKKADWSRGHVVKLDGLAYGKGVAVCDSADECHKFISNLISMGFEKLPLFIEEKCQGEEFSVFAFCDGEIAHLFDPARDYKRAMDGHLGPNTGGMGAFSPLRTDLKARLLRDVFIPVLQEMKSQGAPFRGLLFAGLMVHAEQIQVLEFNARFGDPETQVLLPRMTDDLLDWALASAQGRFTQQISPAFSNTHAVYVVAAAKGYPEKPVLQSRVELPWADWHQAFASKIPPPFFCGGVSEKDGSYFTSGGRVAGALGVGVDIQGAKKMAYAHLEKIRFSGRQFRKDIGE